MAKKAVAEVKKLKITLVKSTIACIKNQKANVEALGLTKVGTYKIHNDTPQIRGMVKKISHMVTVEEV